MNDTKELFTIREATEDDAIKMAPIVNAAYLLEESDFFEGERTSKENIISIMKSSPTHKFFVLEKKNASQVELIGSIFTDVIIKQKKGFFGMLAVNPSYQKRGFAQQLIKYAEEYAIKQGCNIMELDVLSVRPNLLQFYGKFGYKTTGETLEYNLVGNYVKVKGVFHLVVLNKVLL